MGSGMEISVMMGATRGGRQVRQEVSEEGRKEERW